MYFVIKRKYWLYLKFFIQLRNIGVDKIFLQFELFKIVYLDVCRVDDKGSFMFGIFFVIFLDINKRLDFLGNRKMISFDVIV